MMREPIGICAPVEAVRVAGAVPVLVLVAHDRRERRELREPAQDPLADHGVLGHHAPLGVVELAALVEDLVRDRELADVVQQRAWPTRSTASAVRPSSSATPVASRTTCSEWPWV